MITEEQKRAKAQTGEGKLSKAQLSEAASKGKKAALQRGDNQFKIYKGYIKVAVNMTDAITQNPDDLGAAAFDGLSITGKDAAKEALVKGSAEAIKVYAPKIANAILRFGSNFLLAAELMISSESTCLDADKPLRNYEQFQRFVPTLSSD